MEPVGAIGALGPPAEATERDAQLAEVAREFESLLLNMMLKAMRSSVPRSDLFGDQSRVRMYEEMRDEELAKGMAQRGGMGFSELIVRQFESDPGADPNAAWRQTQDLRAAAESYRAYGQAGAPAAPASISQEESR